MAMMVKGARRSGRKKAQLSKKGFFIMAALVGLCIVGCASSAPPRHRARIPDAQKQQLARRTDAALLGYWRIVVPSSNTHFANINPWDPEILLFGKEGDLDVQVESIKLMRGPYDVITSGKVSIKLNHWSSAVVFDYSISNGLLTMKSPRGTQVYRFIASER